MTAQSELPYNQRELEDNLAQAGLVAFGTKITVTPYATGYLRNAQSRRWHYKITNGECAICHLIIGQGLTSVHQKATNFFVACPELACRPLAFWQDAKGLDYLALTHFSGTALDWLVEKGECSAAKWVRLTQQAIKTLEKTRLPSTQTKLEQEIARLLERINALPGMTALDRSILHEIAVPAVLNGALAEPLLTQWSNGDFCGRNLLIDPQGQTRLIDYEFATETHFSRTDWLRLRHFSVLPPDLDVAGLKEFSGEIKPWEEIWFWLQQLSLLADAKHSDSLTHHVNETVTNAFAAMAKATRGNIGQTSASWLIERLTAQHDEDRVSLSDRTQWAQNLESELRQAINTLAQQTKLAEEHISWGRTLEKNLAERTAWAQSLAHELGTTKQNFEKLSQEFAERTAWAKSVDSELTQTQKDFEKLSKKNVEDNVCRLALEKDLSATQADLRREICANDALSKASAGQSLNAELQAHTAEAEIARLKMALQDAQSHVDQLLSQNRDLTLNLSSAAAQQQNIEEALLLSERALSAALDELRAEQSALKRYKNSWIGRIADRFASTTASDRPCKP